MQAYYSKHPDIYENQSSEDDFLKALAQGGFQVGELAKIYGEVPPENDLEGCHGYDKPLERTHELFKQTNVNIAEAAFKYGNCFVRADIIQKKGNHIDLIEVKAKGWDPNKGKFISWKKNEDTSRPGTVPTDIRDYVYDVAFQKYVIENALQEMYPEQQFTVHAYLMMADKSKVNTIPGLNGLFKVKTKLEKGEKRSFADAVPGALEILAKPHEHVLTSFDVDEICDKIIAGVSEEQAEFLGATFVDFVEKQSDLYVNETEAPQYQISNKCFKCPFVRSENHPELKSGFDECWSKKTGLKDEELHDKKNPMISEVNATGFSHGEKDRWIEKGRIFIKQLTSDDMGEKAKKDNGKTGWDHIQRKWIQINSVKNETKDAVVLKKELAQELKDNWHYPLHFIDFETTNSALPYHENMRPYENVAFQFSHHIAFEDGKIEHYGQYLNVNPGEFPNFEFVRELKRQLSNDEGSVFRYATHENTILNQIRSQLQNSNEDDKEELIAFIESITHDGTKGKPSSREGKRDMIDMCDTVKRFFYHPSMKGSNSIKKVLPAVLECCKPLQEKYGKPVYGSEIKSKNYKEDEAFALLKKDANGKVINPYDGLPELKVLEDQIVKTLISEGTVTEEEVQNYLRELRQEQDESGFGDDSQIKNGGAPLVLYRYLQACGKNLDELHSIHTNTIQQALLRYCELDTMAMVLVWECFKEMSK